MSDFIGDQPDFDQVAATPKAPMSNPTSSLRERIKEIANGWLYGDKITAIEQLVADEQKALLHRLHHTEDPATHHCDCLRFQIETELAKLGKEQGK